MNIFTIIIFYLFIEREGGGREGRRASKTERQRQTVFAHAPGPRTERQRETVFVHAPGPHKENRSRQLVAVGSLLTMWVLVSNSDCKV